MILADLVDLTVYCFEHGGDLGDLGSLREPGELVGGHDQVSARSFVDVMAIDTEELFIKVAMERPPLRVKLSLGHRKGSLVCSALRTVDVPVDTGGAVLLGLPFPRGAIDADVEDCAPMERRERKLFGGGFGDSLRRALGLGVWILFQDGLEGCSRASTDV